MEVVSCNYNQIHAIADQSTPQRKKEAQAFSFTASAESCLPETKICLAVTAVAACFAATPGVVAYFAVQVISVIAINAILKISSQWLNHYATSLSNDRQITKTILFITAKILDISRYLNFAFLFEVTAATLIHEMGHATAAFLLYRNASPQIVMLAGGNAYTSYYIGYGLTPLGKLLGAAGTDLVVAAAGPFAAMALACSFVAYAVLHRSHEDDETPSKLLACSYMITMAHLTYALSALVSDPRNLAHDFVALWHHGIHPFVSAAAIVAMPLIVGLGCILCPSSAEQKQPKKQVNPLIAQPA